MTPLFFAELSAVLNSAGMMQSRSGGAELPESLSTHPHFNHWKNASEYTAESHRLWHTSLPRLGSQLWW